MSPLTTKVALDRETSCLRMTGGGNMAMGANIIGTVLSIMTCTMTSKTLGEGRCGAAMNGDSDNLFRWIGHF